MADTVKLTIDGKEVNLADKYKGQVLLVVNVASKCGATPQYAQLEALQDKYHEKGLSVVGFPCNQFGGQEPYNAHLTGVLLRLRFELDMGVKKSLAIARLLHDVLPEDDLDLVDADLAPDGEELSGDNSPPETSRQLFENLWTKSQTHQKAILLCLATLTKTLDKPLSKRAARGYLASLSPLTKEQFLSQLPERSSTGVKRSGPPNSTTFNGRGRAKWSMVSA